MADHLAELEKPRLTDWLRLLIPLLVIAALLVAAWKLGYFQLDNPRRISRTADQVAGTPWLGPIFVAVYAGCAAMAMPVAPLAYTSGAIFDFAKGSVFVWIASIIGGSAGYWLARGIWRDPAKRLLGRYEKKLKAVHMGNPFLAALRMQLLPIVPFGVFNYTAAVSDMPFGQFLAGTAIGIIPGTVAAVFVGHEIMSGLRGSDKRPIWIGLAVAAALVVLSFVPTIVKKLRS